MNHTNKKESPIGAVFRALSDKTRLRILALLEDGELCVCDLVEALGVPQPKASRHLAYLRKVGLVGVRRDGHWSYYHLVRKPDLAGKKLMAALSLCFAEMADTVQDKKRLKVQRRAPGRCD